jgi:hypothetical protein
MPTRRPGTRRKIPNYFGDYHELRLDGVNGWSVGFYCPQLKRWDWERLQSDYRVGKKLEAAVKVAAVKLMRESATRQETELAKALQKVQQLRRQADGIESGRRDWSAL